MKKELKKLLFVISLVLGIVGAVLSLGSIYIGITDIPNLYYPLTAALPLLFFALWCVLAIFLPMILYRYLKEKPCKKHWVAFGVLLSICLLLGIVAKPVNRAIQKNNILYVPQEEKMDIMDNQENMGEATQETTLPQVSAVETPPAETLPAETPMVLDWDSLVDDLAKLGAYEIINHTHKEETNVIIEGVIDNITEDTFDLWVPYNESYYKVPNWNYSISLDGIENGHWVQICIPTYRDGSLAKTSGIEGIRKTDTSAIDNIVEEFKKTCPEIDYKGIMRNPEKAYGTLCKATGTVIQVIKTQKTLQEFLLRLDDGNLVYVAYSKEVGSDNILEDDIVTVYGIFYLTETYMTVLGAENTIPRIPANYVDIQY